MKAKHKTDFTNISCTPETKEMILRESKRIDSYDTFLRKLLILKKMHEKEFDEIKVDEN